MIDVEEVLIVLADLTGIEAFEVFFTHFFFWYSKLILGSAKYSFPGLDPLEREGCIRIGKWQRF